MKFTELNEEQKEKAIEIHRDINVDFEWWDTTRDEFAEDMENIGFNDIKSYFSGFWSQGDGASFETKSVNIEKVLRAMKVWSKYRILHEMIKGGELDIGISQSGRYCHENTMGCYVMDIYINTTDKQDDKIEELIESVFEFAKSKAREYYSTLETLYDNLISDEQVIASIIANDMDFEDDPRESMVTYL